MNISGRFIRSLAFGILTLSATAPFCHAAGGGRLQGDANVIVVSADYGGDLGRRQNRIRELQRQGTRVELRGQCYSACTMYLGLSNTCIEQSARLGFHGPYAARGKSLPRDAFDYWSWVMSRHFKPKLREWFMMTARFVPQGMLVLTGQDLVKMGYREC